MGNDEGLGIDPKNSRFPYSIVWTPIPIISWLVPFIGHAGICRRDGVILDFATSNFISVDNFAFGAVARYVIIGKRGGGKGGEDEDGEWEDGLRGGMVEYQHKCYGFLTCNCHSFVCNCLNRMGMGGPEWNIVNLATCLLLEGRWVRTASFFRTFFPSCTMLFICFKFGGWTMFTLWGCVVFVLCCWFFLGTYVFKGLVHL